MSGLEENVNLAAEISAVRSAPVMPRPLVTPAWTAGDGATFISADFTIDGYDVVHIVAMITAGAFTEEFQSIDCDLEDAEDFAADLMSDARGTLRNSGVSIREYGDLLKEVRNLVGRVQARKVAA